MLGRQALGIDHAPGHRPVPHLGRKRHAHGDIVRGGGAADYGIPGRNAPGRDDAEVHAAITARSPPLEPALFLHSAGKGCAWLAGNGDLERSRADVEALIDKQRGEINAARGEVFPKGP